MAGNKTRHVFRCQHSQRILIKTGKRTEILLRLTHLIPYCASLHKHNPGMTNIFLKERRKEKATGGKHWMGRKWGRGLLLHRPVGSAGQEEKMMPCTACSAVTGHQPLLTHFLGMPFHCPKAAATSKCPWLGLHRTKAGSPLQRISQWIFWSKSPGDQRLPFELGYGIHFIWCSRTSINLEMLREATGCQCKKEVLPSRWL